MELVEPLRSLFKDEVRRVGEQLGLPERMVWRHPFPGPGLAIRIIGDVTEERLAILRAADAILLEEVRRAGLYGELWQCFAVLPAVRSVGVQGDERTYAYPVVIRAVTSEDAMTADWARLPYELLDTISSRIVNEVPGVNRVALDLIVEAARDDRVGVAPAASGPPGRGFSLAPLPFQPFQTGTSTTPSGSTSTPTRSPTRGTSTPTATASSSTPSSRRTRRRTTAPSRSARGRRRRRPADDDGLRPDHGRAVAVAVDVRHPEEAGDPVVGRPRPELVGRRDLREPPLPEDRDAVAELERLADVVRDVDDRQREPLEQLPQVGLEPPPERAVERAERLVEEEHLRARRERAGERDALCLAAREGRHVTPFGPREADELERLGHARGRARAQGARRPSARSRRSRRRRGAGRAPRPGRRARRRAGAPARR